MSQNIQSTSNNQNILTDISINLNALKNSSGTMYFEDNTIKTSSFSLGRSFLGLFSSEVRAQNAKAATLIENTLAQKYEMSGLKLGSTSINASSLSRIEGKLQTQKKAEFDTKIAALEDKFGIRVSAEVKNTKAQAEYNLGTMRAETFEEIARSGQAHEKATYLELKDEMKKPDFKGADTIAKLKSFPSLAKLYAMQNTALGTIGEHTQSVFDQFDSQKGFYKLDDVQARLSSVKGFENFNAEGFMKAVIALHDIGKGMGNTNDQHEHTIPILRETMKAMDFSEAEIRLASNLVNNDLMGEWQKSGSTSKTELKEMRAELRALAEDSGISTKDFLSMQKLFFISDASAYGPIKTTFMNTDAAGKLHFKPTDATTESRIEKALSKLSDAAISGKIGKLISSELSIGAAVTNGKYPLSLFNQDFSNKSYNLYDLTEGILAAKEVLQNEIDKLPSSTAAESNIKALAQTRLDQAVEMATMAHDMQIDRWNPSHTQGIIQARLEIRNAGITDDIPSNLSPNLWTQLNSSDKAVSAEAVDTVIFGDFEAVAKLREPGGVSDRFMELVDAKGGSSKLLNYTGQLQVASSWSPTSMAIKGYLETQRSIDADTHYYHAKGDQHNNFTRTVTDQYEKFAFQPKSYWEDAAQSLNVEGGEVARDAISNSYKALQIQILDDPKEATSIIFDKSVQYQMAMQMELLSQMDFPGNDRVNKEVIIYRTDDPIILQLNDDFSETSRSGKVLRGSSESGSILYPTTVGGSVLTAQRIPYYRITNSFMLAGQHSGPDVIDANRGAILGNDLREFTFMNDGIESYVISTTRSLGIDYQEVGTIPTAEYKYPTQQIL